MQAWVGQICSVLYCGGCGSASLLLLSAILQCSDIDGTMVNQDSDEKEQFWMDARTREFQVTEAHVVNDPLL